MDACTSSRTDTFDRRAPNLLRVARRADGTLDVIGDIDAATSGALDRALRRYEPARHGRRGGAPLVIDMRELGFVDSSGVRNLVAVAASLRASARGSRVGLRNARGDLVRQFTGLSRRFGIDPDTHGDADRAAVNVAERRYGAAESPS
jgi:anti-anti-sigma factor